MKRIVVEPPASDSRRERIERNVMAQLSTLRAAERADAAIPVAPVSNRRAWLFGGIGAAVAATIAIAVMSSNHPAPAPVAAEDVVPTRVITPVGGESQFTVADAVIAASSDTMVDVKRADDGGITLVVWRGSVDCDVAPRKNRPPFHVVAGDVSVEVVGTRFTVVKTPSPRVEVVRGKVRVRAPGGTWLLSAGESWTPPVGSNSEVVAELPPSQAGVVTPSQAGVVTPPAVIPTPAVATAPVFAGHAIYQRAQRLEASDPVKAAKDYRMVASSKDSWAAPALFGLAELEAKSDAGKALADCNEYLKRFGKSAQVEDITWLRVEILRSAGRRDEARVAAGEYLRQFPQGSYAGIAERIASPK